MNGLNIMPTSSAMWEPRAKPAGTRVVPSSRPSVVLAPYAQGEGQQEEEDPRANEDHRSTAGESAAGVLTQFQPLAALLIGCEGEGAQSGLFIDQVIFAAAPMAT